MPTGYGYGNARLRAMHSRLLTKTDYDDLLARADIEELITTLTNTPYKEDIETALVWVGGVRCVFEALRTNLTRILWQIRSFFEGPPQILIDLLLRRWDRHNLLTILRGQSQEASSEEVLSALVPVGQLDDVSLRELARQPGLRATLDLMTTWRLPYAHPLRQVRVRTGSTPDLDQLELALNRFHYTSLFEALGPGNGNKAILGDYLQSEVDLINIRTALRLVRSPELIRLVLQRYHISNVRPLLIEPGGKIPINQIVELVAGANELEAVVHGLVGTRYGAAMQAGWQRYQAEKDGLAPLERALERWQVEYAIKMFTNRPLSIAVPIGYLSSKETEIANLRLIAQAVALNMNRERVWQHLIIAG
jgi:V/A-type H+-transporting ATPase subunit C